MFKKNSQIQSIKTLEYDRGLCRRVLNRVASTVLKIHEVSKVVFCNSRVMQNLYAGLLKTTILEYPFQVWGP